MIVVHMINHVQSRFPERALEWLFACQTAAWGLVLLHPDETFSGQSYPVFSAVASEETMGVAIAAIGIVYLVALFVNGSLARASPIVRAACAAVTFMLYLGIAIGFLWSGFVSTAWAVYPIEVPFAAYCVYRAMRDRGEATP